MHGWKCWVERPLAFQSLTVGPVGLSVRAGSVSHSSTSINIWPLLYQFHMKGCVFGGLLIFFRLNIRSIWAAKLTFWKLERGQRLCWCDSGLWGWSAGGSSQGDLGWEGTLLLIISQSSSHQGHCWEAGKRQQLGVDGQASRAKDSTNLIPIRLLSCWNWTIGLLSSWNWTIKYFSL